PLLATGWPGYPRPNPLWVKGFFASVFGRVERKPFGWRPTVVVGPGVAESEEPVFRMRAGHAGRQRRSWVALPGPCLSGGVEEQLAIDGVADLPFQRAQCVFLGLAVGDFAVEVGAAGGVSHCRRRPT